MLWIFRVFFWVYTCLSLLFVVSYGYIAATASSGPRKGRARLVAGLAFVSWFIVSPLLWTLYESHMPIVECEGTIVSVDVEDSSSRHYSARMWIATASGEQIEVHVSDRSDAWRVGQRTKVRYFEGDGELIRATLFGPDGKQEGEMNRTAGVGRAISVLMGLVLAWAVWKRYRNDPDGTSEVTRPPSGISNAIDEKSLLHLSAQRVKEGP